MSEYQYYEWRALDRLLTPEEQAAVNELSSHIHVTESYASVTYNWSDFGHDPIQVLELYFDAFIYLTNWGSRQLAFRFPKDLLDTRSVEPYLVRYFVDLQPGGEYSILDITMDNEDALGWVEGEGWLSSLSPLRGDLLEGDYRMLYLAWLRASELDDAHEDNLEPPVPPGLRELTPPLASFVEFFALDKYLLQAAAEASLPWRPSPTVPPEEAIARLSPAERDDFLVRLARGEPLLSLKLNRRLQELARSPRPTTAPARRRTWGELRSRAAQLRREAG